MGYDMGNCLLAEVDDRTSVSVSERGGRGGTGIHRLEGRQTEEGCVSLLHEKVCNSVYTEECYASVYIVEEGTTVSTMGKYTLVSAL